LPACSPNPRFPRRTKTDLSTKLAAYQRDFAAWMEGMNAVIAGQKAVSEAFTRIEPAIEDINATIARTALDAGAAASAARDDTGAASKSPSSW